MLPNAFNPFRIIPVLLIDQGRLVKTTKFANPSYVGDLVNSVRIFNEKEVDELAILDISASKRRQPPNFDLIREVTDECFMPLAVGGGITEVSQVRRLIGMGVEKVIMNTAAMMNLELISQAADAVGSQSVVVSVDVKKNFFGKYCARSHSGSQAVDAASLPDLVQRLVAAGAGEVLLNNIDRDGTLTGYDHALVRQIAGATDVPVISCGGASSVEDLARAVVQSGAAACAAGALFTYRGPHRAVLLNYPNPTEVNTAVNEFFRS